MMSPTLVGFERPIIGAERRGYVTGVSPAVYEFKVLTHATLQRAAHERLTTLKMLALDGWKVGTITLEGDLILERRIA